MPKRHRAAIVATLATLVSLPAAAHGIAGARFFPVTLTLDDPAVADEASLPTVVYQPNKPGSETDYGFEWDKRLTENFGFAFNDQYRMVRQPAQAGGNLLGWDDPILTFKYQFFENDAHEILASVGVQKEFGGIGAVSHGLADSVGWTQPTLYAGKGLGDLPPGLGLLRPFAITGEFGYQRADVGTSTSPDGARTPNPNFLNIGASVYYDMSYLRSQVKDYGLPEFANHLIPIVEFAYSTPASSQYAGITTTGTVAPGVLYEAAWYQVGLEALIPATHASGSYAGFIAQFHIYLDDLLPGSPLGKPLF